MIDVYHIKYFLSYQRIKPSILALNLCDVSYHLPFSVRNLRLPPGLLNHLHSDQVPQILSEDVLITNRIHVIFQSMPSLYKCC